MGGGGSIWGRIGKVIQVEGTLCRELSGGRVEECGVS